MPAQHENREVNIKTPLGKDILLLHSMSMHEKLGRLFSMDLELLSIREDIKFEDILGQNITVELDLINDEKRYFNGHISQFSQTGDEGSYAVYHATVRPWFWFLTRTADCRIFQDISVPDIIKEVFRELGYTDFEDKLSSNYRTWDYCVQYRETDFNFVSRLMEQEGIYYYFLHDEKSHTLVLSDGYASHEPIPHEDNIPFYPPDNTVVREEEHVSSWSISKQLQPGKYELNEFDFVKPRANLIANSEISREHTLNDYEVYDYPGEYVASDDGVKYVQVRIEELHSQYEQAQGHSDVRSLNTGSLFTLREYPREDQNREYLISAAQHNIQLDVFRTGKGSDGSPVYMNSFSAVESNVPYRPARTSRKPIIQGAQTAIVVGPSGEEIYTDKYGRVKLQFHWDRYGEANENSSCWVRVAQLWAGKTWGGIHIPRIGQEVIVHFLEGDPDRPIITGRVYNADQMPPYELPANKTQSGIKSRSSKGGTGANFNEIRMEDKKGSEELYIHAEKNHTNITENDRNEDVGHDRSLHVGHDKSEAVDNDKSITIGVNHTEAIGNNKQLSVGVNHSEQIGSNMTINVGTNLTETVGINYAETVGAAMELTIGAVYVQSVGISKTVTLGTSKSETIGTSKTVSIGTDQSEDVGSNKSISIGENLSETVGDSHSESVTKAYSLQAKTVSVVAGDSITLQTGKASITMKKDGTINIVGKDITVKGSGKIDVSASNNITMKGQNILQN